MMMAACHEHGLMNIGSCSPFEGLARWAPACHLSSIRLELSACRLLEQDIVRGLGLQVQEPRLVCLILLYTRIHGS